MQHIQLIEEDGSTRNFTVDSDLPFNMVNDDDRVFSYSHSFTDHERRETIRVYRRGVTLDLIDGEIHGAGNYTTVGFWPSN